MPAKRFSFELCTINGRVNYKITCTKCGAANTESAFRCSRCASILEVAFDYGAEKPKLDVRAVGISKYADLLPVRRPFGLGEGRTPLKKVKSAHYGFFIKVETGNPTGTFKDRGSAVEISKALELGADSVVCASTGNMGLSVAHYARKAGIRCTIFISGGANKNKIKKIENEKAIITKVDGDFNSALKLAEQFALKTGAFVCGDYHYRKEGQKTIAFEIMEQLRGHEPDYIFIPVGNATLFSGTYKGLVEFERFGLIKRIPRLIAVQSEKCGPLVAAYEDKKRITYVRPKTEADAIAVGYPTFGNEALEAIRKTNGSAISVGETEIKEAVIALEEHRIYAELGGGTGYAGFIKYSRGHQNKMNSKIAVVVVTGNNEGVFRRS
jgi:threonine synthase